MSRYRVTKRMMRAYKGQKKTAIYRNLYAAKRRRILGVRQPVQYFTRSFYTPEAIQLPPATAAFGKAYTFSLSQLPNFGEFQNLYDQYKINMVKFQLIPRFTNASSNSSVPIGNLWSVIDYDDSAAPSSINDVLQYQNLKRSRMNVIHKRIIKPKILTQIFSGTLGADSPTRRFIDCTYATTPHFGLKLWVDENAAPSGATLTWDLQCKFYLAMKNVR